MHDLPFSPAAERNKHPILAVLQAQIGARGTALEIASGTGQHAAWFADALPGWSWQPTDADADALPALAQRVALARHGNLQAPVRLDVMRVPWAVGLGYDLLFCANMLHIAPWATCAALMHGAVQCLAEEGQMLVYGPFLEDDVVTAPGNLAFDKSLRARNPQWGIRRIEDVHAQAAQVGLTLRGRHQMPANNLLLVFGRR